MVKSLMDVFSDQMQPSKAGLQLIVRDLVEYKHLKVGPLLHHLDVLILHFEVLYSYFIAHQSIKSKHSTEY